MARKSKEKSPYDDSAGRGTGDYLAKKPTKTVEPASSTRSKPMAIGKKELEATQPSNSLMAAILATIFCFPPLGLLGIVYALRVRPRWKRGDEAGAKHAADMAEKLAFAAVGLFVIIFFCTAIGYGIYWFFGPRNKP